MAGRPENTTLNPDDQARHPDEKAVSKIIGEGLARGQDETRRPKVRRSVTETDEVADNDDM